jgi:Family of unknown function (DUF5750)
MSWISHTTVFKNIHEILSTDINYTNWRSVMKVEIFDYGSDSDDYYITYKVTGLDLEDQEKLRGNVEGNVELKNGDVFITTHFEEKYFPLGSDDAHLRMDDFIAREEIEMTVYLTSLLEDEELEIFK